jgi:hypothetical protein
VRRIPAPIYNAFVAHGTARPDHLNGYRALLSAAIAVACDDARAGIKDAIEYLESPRFDDHAALLDLPADRIRRQAGVER